MLTDELIRLHAWLQRWRPDSLQALAQALEKARDEIIAEIERTKNQPETGRLAKLKKRIDTAIAAAYEGIYEQVSADAEEAARIGYDTAAAALGEYIGLKLDSFDNLPKSAINKILDPDRPILGETLRESLLNMQYTQSRRVRKAVAAALIDGAGIDEAQRTALMAEATENLFGRFIRHEINTVVRTATMAALHEGEYAAYDTLADSGYIVGWRSLATLDGRTSYLCASLDQEFYPIEKYPTIESVPNKPPRHYNCRSMLIPETKTSQKLTGKRPYAIHDANKVQNDDGTTSTKYKVEKAGQVRGDTSFGEWFARQSAEFQRDYLGPSRYELYKSGKVGISELYDITRQKTLTLAELRGKIKKK